MFISTICLRNPQDSTLDFLKTVILGGGLRGIQQSCVCEVEEVPDIPPVWSFFNMLIILTVKSWHCQSFTII